MIPPDSYHLSLIMWFELHTSDITRLLGFDTGVCIFQSMLGFTRVMQHYFEANSAFDLRSNHH